MASADHSGHHIVPAALLTKVLAILVVLTVITVFTAKFMDLGHWEVPVAFSIALVKALLVMGYFMGLKYESLENKVVFASGFFFLALLFFFCALDIYSRVSQASVLN